MFNYGDKVAWKLTVWVIPASSLLEVVKGVWDRNRRLLVLLSRALNYALTDVKKVRYWAFSSNDGTSRFCRPTHRFIADLLLTTFNTSFVRWLSESYQAFSWYAFTYSATSFLNRTDRDAWNVRTDYPLQAIGSFGREASSWLFTLRFLTEKCLHNRPLDPRFHA